jgi:hypothetical protein
MTHNAEHVGGSGRNVSRSCLTPPSATQKASNGVYCMGKHSARALEGEWMSMSTTHPRPTQPGTMTYEEVLEWADEDTLAEWVDGKEYTDDRRRRWQRRGL